MRFFIPTTILLLFIHATFGQSKEALKLEDIVYNLNNQQQYDSSFQVINHFLNQKGITNEDRFFAHLYLSYTNKRFLRYEVVFKNLDSALYWGLRTNKPQYYQANITCQKSFAMFDLRKYDVADSLMQILIKDNYQ